MNQLKLETSPIDIVITWVDDSDEEWKAERDRYLGEFHEVKSNLDHYFRDWDTLRYLFRGIEHNLPWVRNVHFITCGHLPKWLNTKAPKLKIHKHCDFFAEGTVQPTFSARPIEMNFMNIPGLAEKFIYFNDDMVAIRPVNPDRFFRDGMPVDYLALDYPRGGWLYEKIRVKDPYARTVRNSIDLLNELFPLRRLFKERPELFLDESYTDAEKRRTRLMRLLGIYKWIKVNHNPQPFLLSNLKECERLFPERIKQTRTHRFREYSDLNQYLFRDYALMTGRFFPHYFNDDFCMVLASVERYMEERRHYQDKNFICLNDTAYLSREEYPELKKKVTEDMEAIFPHKSSFEM